MDQDERNALNKEQLLYTMLCALVKSNDGEIRISEKQMDTVTKHDMLAVYHDKKNGEVILSMNLLSNSWQDEIF